MRFFLISFVFHILFIGFSNFSVKSEPIEFKKVGDPNVSFSMVEGTAQPATPKKDKVEKKVKEKIERKKNKKVKRKKVVKSIEKKVTPKPKEEVIEVPKKNEEKEIIKEKEIEEEIIKEEISEDEKILEEDALEIQDNLETEEEEEPSEVVEDQTEESSLPSDSFIKLDDGSLVAKNQGVKGLHYGWIDNPDPSYPPIARKMKYDKDVIIKVRFLVGYDGKIEDVKFFDNMTSYGFRSEVLKTLKHWQATPITVGDKKVKLYFFKSFKFEKL